MALIKKIPTLLTIPMTPSATNMVWMKIAKEYCNTYLQTGMNAGQGATTLPGIAATLGMECIEATAVSTPVGMLTAVKLAKAFNNCLMTYMSLFQTSPPITAPGFPQLINDFNAFMVAPENNPLKFPKELGKALDTFTIAAQVIGVVPGTPPVPFAGPIS